VVTPTLPGDGTGCWTAGFYDFGVVLAQLDGELAGLGDVAERARRNGARQGTPVVVHTAGWVDARVNAFFRSVPMVAARPATWRRYAFALVVWLNFLEVVGRAWDEATAADVEAFKEWRLSDRRNSGRVAPTSFDTDRAALNSFYRWAGLRYGTGNPVPSVTTGARGRRANGDWRWGTGPDDEVKGRDGLRPAQARRRQVKWMLRPAFEQWRDVGLRGYGFDGLRRSGWRGGGCEDRDAAFVDGLYGTGLRLAEWASVLDVELPEADGRRSGRAWLAAACAKGGRAGRLYRIPRSVLASLAGYLDQVEGSRPAAVRRAQAARRYEALYGVRVVTGYHPRSRALSVAGPEGTAQVPVDVLGPEERSRLFRRSEAGLEPLWLWLGPDGLPKRPHGWQDTFAAANARVATAWQAAGGRAGERPLWARPHMLRHSFCLKWFPVLSAVWEQRVDGFTGNEVKDLRYQFGDIWFQLATLMGHADPAVTRDVYLGPFTGLQVDYLMSLLDEDEKAGLDALVRAVAADGAGRVLAGRQPPPGPARAAPGAGR
jgi:integrase